MLGHVVDDLLDGDVDRVLDDSFIDVSDDALDHAELLEQLAPCVQHFLGEDVLLAVDPEVGEAFLGRVQDLREVAEAAFLVEHFVGFGELLPVTAVGAVGLEDFAETLHLVQEALAGALAIFGV